MSADAQRNGINDLSSNNKLNQSNHKSIVYKESNEISQKKKTDSKCELNENQVAIPQYLSNILTPYYDDIWCTCFFDVRLVAQLMSEGFLPIASRELLLPKLHMERCVIRWPDFHISKSVKKKCKRWLISINQDFDGVVRGCHKQHGISWLYPQIVKVFKTIHQSGENGFETLKISRGEVIGKTSVRLYSVEIWNPETNELVAGELGYTIGNIYTSLTGFSAENSAGSVQLAALGRILEETGFIIWDLGMYLKYKEDMGAHLMPRSEFVEMVRSAREEGPSPVLNISGKLNIDNIVRPEGKKKAQKSELCKKRGENMQNMKRSRDISPKSVQSLKPSISKKKLNDYDVEENVLLKKDVASTVDF